MNTWGQLLYVALYNATGGYYWNNYCYDANGNLSYAAYRFAAPNQNNNSCSGAGDAYTYDALGRVTKIVHGTGAYVTYGYNGRDTQVTDENGVSRVIEVDGLGRPTAVCEVYGSQQNATCGLSNNPASGFKTTYVYATDTTAGNALKTTVTQGAQTRIFETDWLGRTTSVMQPESGTSTYSYAYSTAAGLGLAVTRVSPQANQTGSAQTTTTSQYDALGRLVTVNYSDGTPNRTFAYDTNTYWTQVGSNLKGRLAATGGGANLPSWNGSSIGYDTMGRVTQMWQCGPATCGTSNQAARPLTFAYELGRRSHPDIGRRQRHGQVWALHCRGGNLHYQPDLHQSSAKSP